MPFLPPSFTLYYYVFLPVKLYFENLDLVYFPNYMLPVIFRGKSLVMLTEDIHYEMSSGSLPFRYRLAYRVFANWAAKHATKIVTMSESSRGEVAKLFSISPERISVNHLGINIGPELRSLHGAHVLHGRHVMTGAYILYVGQAFPRRHLKETILAFEQIAPRFPNLHLVAVGKDKYNPSIIADLVKTANQRLGREAVIHKDYVSEAELADLYANARCLIYVSSKEAFGLPPFEALAYGTAPVVSLSGAAEEILGDKAFFVDDPDSVEAIAAAMREALTNQAKRSQIISSASQILGQYTWSAHADRFLDIIRQMVKRQ